ncbi:MAG: peptidoglycan-binding domain-containing protein [Candidatus Paceibacterota bacterium]|jgi:hypothetical protein
MSKFTKTIAGVVSGLALAATVAGVASAATFTSNLTVGSTGAEVTALQTWLVAKGYLVMPTGVAYGYFGGLTKAAVAAYQTAKGITPTAGYFGPVTRAAVNAEAAMGTGSTVPGCAAGAAYSATTGQPCTGTTPGATTGGLTMDGSDGSITVSFSPYVTSSQTLKKGETKDIYSVKLKATSGKVAVTRFDVHFSERPWLVFTKLTLRDSNGNVIATKFLSSAADSTEVTVGSDYLVRFEGFSYTVDPAVEATVIVSATVASASDKITGQTVSVTIPTGSIRTINGRGYTDSLGISNTNSVTLTSTGSTGDIYTRVSPNTPDTRIVTSSASQTTPDVVLGVFSIKSQNQTSTVNSMNFTLQTMNSGETALGPQATSMFQNVRLKVGSQVYGASTFATTTIFTNLNINLPQDQWTDVTLLADLLANTAASASTTIDASTIAGVDANFSSLTVSNAADATSNKVKFQTSGISVSNMSASYTLTTGGANGNTTGAAVTFTFTVTNTGNSDVYISKVPGVALATSTTGSAGSPATASSTITYVTASPSTYASDTGTAPSSGAYVVPAGASRTLTYSGSLDNTNGTAGIRVFKITTINFGTSAATPTGSSINFNLDPLTVTPNLAAN